MTKKEENKDNLRFYELLRKVPEEAKKNIQAGRLKGFTDVNPLYRIKIMTEAFGPCGIGWKYEIVKQWQETYGQEVKSFTNINLYIKVDGEWSDPIPGTGGATIVEVNSKGAYVNDEGHKMSLTDALSVAMKSLGVAADVYYSKDVKSFDTKYDQQVYTSSMQQPIQTVDWKKEIDSCADMNALTALWNKYPQLQTDKVFRDAWATKRGIVEKK